MAVMVGSKTGSAGHLVDLDALTRRIGAMAAKIDAATAELLGQIRPFDAHEGWAKRFAP